jgi:D-glycerate 3-kinase
MDAIVAHVLQRVAHSPHPVFVAVQGPQGSGKTYLSAQLKSLLPQSLNVALLSVDDLYLPHHSLVALAADHPDNPLLSGRGQPGTHDIKFGEQLLSQLKSQLGRIELPRFDKSLFNGEGDRLPMGLNDATFVQSPVHVVILEGWCVGFHSISEEDLHCKWAGVWQEEKAMLGLSNTLREVDISFVNDKLKEYEPMWSFFDVFIQVSRELHLFNPVTRSCAAYTEDGRNISFSLLYHLQMALGAGAQHEGVQRRTRDVRRSCQIVSYHSLSEFVSFIESM